MVDENGVELYEGRACKECGSKIRLSQRAYGSRNIGACRECAIHQQQEREHGKQLKRLSVLVNEHTHKFIVHCIERSGAVEVAPRSLMEWLEVKDLVNRCRMMNQQELALDTGIKWELCHYFPASGGGTEFRGKATVENLVIAQYEQNRREGNSVPDEWNVKQVITVADARLIQNSYEAAKAWKEARTWVSMNAEEKAAFQERERETIERHKQLVTEVTRGFSDSLPIFELESFQSFSQLLERVENQWNKLTLRMSNQISAALQSGRKLPYLEVREQRLTIDALSDAYARCWIIYQTLQQLADAEYILREKGLSDEQETQLATLKRCAVMWAHDVNDNPKQLVMGFSHPLLAVLGNQWIWGTRYDEATGQQWLCVWDSPTKHDLESPFDVSESTPMLINAVFVEKETKPVREWGIDEARAWRSTDVDYIHERERVKRARIAAEKRQESLKAKVKEQVNNRIVSLKKWLAEEVTSDLYALYGYAAKMLHELQQEQAIEIIGHQFELLANYDAELLVISQEDYYTVEAAKNAIDTWQANSRYRINLMTSGGYVFRELLNPF